jgi:sulfur relay (sulfurtransferase) DsrF/TusC family protein
MFVTARASDINNNNIGSAYTLKPDGECTRFYCHTTVIQALENFFEENRIHTLTDENGTYFLVPTSKTELMLQKLYHAETFLFNVEQWYCCLEHVQLQNSHGTTYCPVTPTLIIPLYDDHLRLIQKLHVSGGKMTEFDKKAMKELCDRIQNKMDPNKDYFVRLSTRSPKDSMKLEQEDQHLKPIDQLQKRNDLLKVRDAKHAIELIMNSTRTIYDITAFFKYKGNYDAINLILRDWMTNLRQDMEFRCYISNKKLTCISQYHCYHVFESLQDETLLMNIRGAIVAFHEQVSQVLPYENYVMDVMYQENGELIVIECNPFGSHMSSGSGLFNWETDREILYGETTADYPVMRVLKELKL